MLCLVDYLACRIGRSNKMIIVIMMLLYYIEKRSFHIRRGEKNMR